MQELKITMTEQEKHAHHGFTVYSDATPAAIDEGITRQYDLINLVCYGERMRSFSAIYGFENKTLAAYEKCIQEHASLFISWDIIFDDMHAHIDRLEELSGRERDFELRALQEIEQEDQLRCLTETFCVALAKSRVAGDYEDITCMVQYAHKEMQGLVLAQRIHDHCWEHALLDLDFPMAFSWLDVLGELSMQKAALDVIFKK